MSIIVTVYIPEGIIMATDSRLTGTAINENGIKYKYTLSDNSQKLFLIKNDSIGISCCGDAVIGGKSVGDFIRNFEIEKVQKDDNINEITEKLIIYTMDKHGEGVSYYVCGYLEDEPYVYKIENHNMDRQNIGKENRVLRGATWNGETSILTRLLLSDKPLACDWDFMQLKDGIDLAEFLVDVTCKTQRFAAGLTTCGGPIDILVITKDYSKWIRHKVLCP